MPEFDDYDYEDDDCECYPITEVEGITIELREKYKTLDDFLNDIMDQFEYENQKDLIKARYGKFQLDIKDFWMPE